MRSSVASFILAAVSVSASPSLLLSVSAPTAVEDVANLKVTTTVTNIGDESVTLLKTPESVLDPFETNTFQLKSESGAVPDFTGAKGKFAIDRAEQTTLAAGESLNVDHSLAGVYDLTSTGEGLYNLDANPRFHYLTEGGKIATVLAVTEPASSRISGKLAENVDRPSTGPPGRTVGFNGCSSSQQTQITTAATNANTYVANAISYLNGISSGTTRYTTWFGTYSSTNEATVQSHYTLIGTDPTSTTYNCTCTKANTYAYVYASAPGYVYLCPVFWKAPATGTDSQAGTIVHEQSHFTVNGGTKDYAYGQSNAAALASSNPGQAIFNADNHEYFAENNPALA
ncbi:deuterolysin M35 metalloprotease [Peniophora sp. CONT]|nr:deuterolysin M35 metalloprotease [Peniophora sp. CONT]